MKKLLGPLEIRRRLIREEKGFREKLVDWIFNKSAAPPSKDRAASNEKVKIWPQFTKDSSASSD